VPGKKFYIDFGMNNDGLDGSPTASPDANNNHWNNIGPAEGVNGPRTEDAGLTTNLVASDGTATSYVLTTGSTIQWNGVRNGSLLDPDPELLGDLAIATATHDYLFISDAQTAVLDFTGLNPARRYRFNVFGSRIADSDPGNRIGVLTINGENTAYGIHQMGGKNMLGQGIDRNDRNIFVSDLITPDADGKITFTLSRSLGMSHINVIKLEETLVTYAITYHLNGGTGDESAVYTVEEAFTLPTPTRTAYTFAGWYDNAEFTGTAVTEIPQGSEGNKAFYAKWEATAYPIIYHTNEGVAIPDGSYTIESETITLPTPTRADHTFLGWYESERFGGDPVTEIPQGSTGKKEFWAKWERVVGLDVVNAGLRLYPNPVVNGNLTIHNILTDNGKIDIYSVLGTLAGSYEVTGNTTVIDISALPVGTYLVKVNGRIAKIVKK
jgi:uncharacterized repeat protein (TIGR02543 family)